MGNEQTAVVSLPQRGTPEHTALIKAEAEAPGWRRAAPADFGGGPIGWSRWGDIHERSAGAALELSNAISLGRLSSSGPEVVVRWGDGYAVGVPPYRR